MKDKVWHTAGVDLMALIHFWSTLNQNLRSRGCVSIKNIEPCTVIDGGKDRGIAGWKKPEDLKVAELKNLLETIGKSKKGEKADLIAR